jgi:uncharacterized protein with ParB-like and HNH nuclease domain
MAFTCDTQNLSVTQLLSDSNVFRVPLFQRPFAWGEENAAQLYDDLHLASSSEADGYFLGPVVVSQESNFSPFDIIDGQQRLITLSIFLAIFRDLLPAGSYASSLQDHLRRPYHATRNLPEAPRLELREDDQQYFETYVQTPGGTLRAGSGSSNGNERRFQDIVRRIKNEIGHPADKYIKDLSYFLLNRCHLILIKTRNIDDGYTLFRSINTSGQPLTDLDIVRGDIIAKSPRGGELAKIWEMIEGELGEDELRSYIASAISYVDPQLATIDLNRAMRRIIRNPLQEQKLHKALTSFLISFKKIEDNNLGEAADGDRINRRLRYLKALPFDNWKPLLLEWLLRDPRPIDTFHFIRALDALCTGLTVLGCTVQTISTRFQKIRARIEAGNALNSLQSELYLSGPEKDKIREKLDQPLSFKTKALRYLLLRLNAEMLDHMLVPDFPAKVEVEHVLPQKPSPRSVWLKNFPDKQKRLALCQLLGNFAILTKPVNSKASNYDFVKKRETIFGIKDSNTFPITAQLINYPDWNEEAIRKRHGQLHDLACQIISPHLYA